VQSFNGRWFAGRTIRAVPIPLANYHTMFPDSVNAVRPLKPDSWTRWKQTKTCRKQNNEKKEICFLFLI